MNGHTNDTSGGSSDTQINLRKAYARPELTRLGDIRAVTLAGSRGLDESGAPLTRKNSTPKMGPVGNVNTNKNPSDDNPFKVTP